MIRNTNTFTIDGNEYENTSSASWTLSCSNMQVLYGILSNVRSSNYIGNDGPSNYFDTCVNLNHGVRLWRTNHTPFAASREDDRRREYDRAYRDVEHRSTF